MSDVIGKTTIFVLSFIAYMVFIVIAMKMFEGITKEALTFSLAYICFCTTKDSFFNYIFGGQLEKAVLRNFLILSMILLIVSNIS